MTSTSGLERLENRKKSIDDGIIGSRALSSTSALANPDQDDLMRRSLSCDASGPHATSQETNLPVRRDPDQIVSPKSPPLVSFDLRPEDLFPASSTGSLGSLFGPIESLSFNRQGDLQSPDSHGSGSPIQSGDPFGRHHRSNSSADYEGLAPYRRPSVGSNGGMQSIERITTGLPNHLLGRKGSLTQPSSPYPQDQTRLPSWSHTGSLASSAQERSSIPGSPMPKNGQAGDAISPPLGKTGSVDSPGLDNPLTRAELAIPLQVGRYSSTHLSPLIKAKLPDSCREQVCILEYGSRTIDHAIIAEALVMALQHISLARSDGTAAAQPFYEVMHQKDTGADFGKLQNWLKSGLHSYTRSETYDRLECHLDQSSRPDLRRVFTKLIPCQPNGPATLPNSVDIGISILDLHWLHTIKVSTRNLVNPVFSAKVELQSWLKWRALEVRKDGLLLMVFATDSSQDGTRSPTPSDRSSDNFFEQVPEVLIPCLNRLVSTGLLNQAVASKLMRIPLHLRNQDEIDQWLSSDLVQDFWIVEHREPSRNLRHPAALRFKQGLISEREYSQEIVQIVRILYESFFRRVLKESHATGSGRGTTSDEVALDALWDVLAEKIEEGSYLQTVDTHFGFFIMRRK